MTQCPCQCQSLRLSTGKSDAAAPDMGMNTLFHLGNFLVKAHHFQKFLNIFILSHKDIILNTVIEQLRVMPQISNDAYTFSVVQPA